MVIAICILNIPQLHPQVPQHTSIAPSGRSNPEYGLAIFGCRHDGQPIDATPYFETKAFPREERSWTESDIPLW